MNLRRQFESGRRVFSMPAPHIFTRPNNEHTRSQIEMDGMVGGGRVASSRMPPSATIEMSGAQGGPPTLNPADLHLRNEWFQGRLTRSRPGQTLEDEEAERWARMPRCMYSLSFTLRFASTLLIIFSSIRAKSNRHYIPWLSMTFVYANDASAPLVFAWIGRENWDLIYRLYSARRWGWGWLIHCIASMG